MSRTVHEHRRSLAFNPTETRRQVRYRWRRSRPSGGRLYLGGSAERSARLTVLRSIPYRRTSSLISTPRSKYSWCNSAHRTTSSILPPQARSPRPTQGPATPGRLYPALNGVRFNRQRGVGFPPAPTPESGTLRLLWTCSTAEGERDVLAKIAEMSESDRAIAERLHAISKARAQPCRRERSIGWQISTKAHLVDRRRAEGVDRGMRQGSASSPIRRCPEYSPRRMARRTMCVMPPYRLAATFGVDYSLPARRCSRFGGGGLALPLRQRHQQTRA